MAQNPQEEMASDDKICWNCRYFYADCDVRSPHGAGECRRNSPSVHPTRILDKRWPYMSGNDWCGDFEA